jgi:hypothetical protein
MRPSWMIGSVRESPTCLTFTVKKPFWQERWDRNGRHCWATFEYAELESISFTHEESEIAYRALQGSGR